MIADESDNDSHLLAMAHFLGFFCVVLCMPEVHFLKIRWGRSLVLAVMALLLVAVGGFAWWKYRAKGDDLSHYQLVKVQRTDLEDLVTATGSLQPREYVDVGAQVSGQLKKIYVEIGSVVQAGDLLAEIDPTVYRANVDARRAQLKNLQASILDKRSQLVLARQQQVRQRGLLAGDATTLELVQQAEASVRSAEAQIAALEAQIEQSESTLRADEANLNYASIYSPMSGVVVSITARQGQTINATQQAPVILRVADLSSMTVQTQVSEADISQLRPGMDAYFTTLGNRGRRWWGTLRKVEPTPTVTNNVVLYNALFDVVNDQRNLLPQMTAQVFFVANAVEDALVVPASAVTIERAAVRDGRSKAHRAAASGVGAASAVVSSAPSAPPAKAPNPVKPRRVEASGGAAAPDFSQMSREERRAMFERMSPQEREGMRDRMRAARAQQEAGAVVTKPAARPERPASAPRTPAAVWAGVGSSRKNVPRQGVVKVVLASGQIEERQVKVGISNRVQVQILEGLKEGEQVVAGVKPPPGQQRSDGNNSRNALQGQAGGMPGGPGGLGGGAGSSGGRAR